MAIISKEELIKWQTDEEFQFKMIERNAYNLGYIINPSYDLKLKAININGETIQYIKDQNEELKINAVRSSRYAIRYIKDQNEEILNEIISNRYLKYLNEIIRYIDIIKFPEFYNKYKFLNY